MTLRHFIGVCWKTVVLLEDVWKAGTARICWKTGTFSPEYVEWRAFHLSMFKNWRVTWLNMCFDFTDLDFGSWLLTFHSNVFKGRTFICNVLKDRHFTLHVYMLTDRRQAFHFNMLENRQPTFHFLTCWKTEDGHFTLTCWNNISFWHVERQTFYFDMLKDRPEDRHLPLTYFTLTFWKTEDRHFTLTCWKTDISHWCVVFHFNVLKNRHFTLTCWKRHFTLTCWKTAISLYCVWKTAISL